MRKPLVSPLLALAFPVLLVGIASQANAAEWRSANGGDSFTVTNDTSIASGEVVSIRYTCDVATHQQLDVAIPSSIFNAKFKGAKNIGIVLTSELVTNFPDGAVFGSVKSYQKKTIDRSFENAGKTLLSFESTGIQALEIADAFAKSNRPVVLGLFESGRKAPITQKDILLDFKIPVEGSTKAFGEAFSRCKFAY